MESRAYIALVPALFGFCQNPWHVVPVFCFCSWHSALRSIHSIDISPCSRVAICFLLFDSKLNYSYYSMEPRPPLLPSLLYIYQYCCRYLLSIISVLNRWVLGEITASNPGACHALLLSLHSKRKCQSLSFSFSQIGQVNGQVTNLSFNRILVGKHSLQMRHIKCLAFGSAYAFHIHFQSTFSALATSTVGFNITRSYMLILHYIYHVYHIAKLVYPLKFHPIS
jgi:hypothetical protein